MSTVTYFIFFPFKMSADQHMLERPSTYLDFIMSMDATQHRVQLNEIVASHRVKKSTVTFDEV